MLKNINNKKLPYNTYNFNARSYKEDYRVAGWDSENTMINKFKLAADTIKFDGISDWLDVGCGPGSFFKYINASCNMTGVDISEDVVARANTNYPNATYNIMDVEKLSFPDESFDLITMVGVLDIIAIDPHQAIMEAMRVSKGGGIVYIATKNINWMGFRGGSKPDTKYNWYSISDITDAIAMYNGRSIYMGGYDESGGEIVSLNDSDTMFIFAMKNPTLAKESTGDSDNTSA